MISFFETTSYLIGLISAAATFFFTESKPPSLEITKDYKRHVLMDVGI